MNKEVNTAGEEMLCAILYLENSDEARFSDLNKRVENDYVLNKVEYPWMVTSVQSLLLNYQSNYNSNRNCQSNGVRSQLMFVTAYTIYWASDRPAVCTPTSGRPAVCTPTVPVCA